MARGASNMSAVDLADSYALTGNNCRAPEGLELERAYDAKFADQPARTWEHQELFHSQFGKNKQQFGLCGH
jgi:hypothetical protein